ncbi:(d)CMP kinase [Rhodobacterales bacterium LSUCC0387]|nr:(d)CMP kinase [Rhodobacterales bacterium LSUCC0387]
MIFKVAIDGPAAAGKGTISRRLADQFGFAHLDTGLLYRAVGAKVADGAAPEIAAQNLTAADLARIDLRSHAIGQVASKVAVIPEVRSALVTFQRDFARQSGGAVLDGRDIGTVICPDADLKLFVTARPEVRAHRRYLELGGNEALILNELIERDSRDMSRADAPLRVAEDAVVIDTSDLDIEAAVRLAADHVAARLKG